ncbi:MAG TPA: Xaa-Pro peptidase family protein, partial [Blastocatellia bacterium]|nr:Xaa-Pro peptidase family protein [Blastocatellia bacterium]
NNSRVSKLRRTLMALSIAVTVLAPAFLARVASSGEDQLANQPKSEYAKRRQALMQKLKDGIVVLIGQREEDLGEVARFRQKNDFMYLTGVETPAASLILVPAGLIPGKPASETVFIPPRNPTHEQWNGVQLGPGKEAENIFGVQEVAGSDRFKDRLNDLLNSAAFKGDSGSRRARLYTIIPDGKTAEIERETHFVARIRQATPHVTIIDVSPIIAEMRKVKSAAEIALLQKAIDITSEGQREAARTIRPGAFEYEAQAAIEAAFARNGSERPGFPSIIGSGIYSTILHYNTSRKKIEAGDLVVVDVGAEYSYYTADITRTFPASGKFAPRQREIYQLVLEAQRAAERAFKPGVSTIASLHSTAAGVMRASPLRDSKGNTLDKYFIHGLGHWLGMDVHDSGDYSTLPTGAVFTIEPGIYIPEEKLGVRIEDDYLATDTGLVKLSRALASEPDDVERMMTNTQSAVRSAGGLR